MLQVELQAHVAIDTRAQVSCPAVIYACCLDVIDAKCQDLWQVSRHQGTTVWNKYLLPRLLIYVLEGLHLFDVALAPKSRMQKV
jgi:hypothetical protein